MRLVRKTPGGISPSQIQLWRSCQKAWGFRYLRGIYSPPTDSTRLGSRVHVILEAWLRDGTKPDPNEVLQTSKGLRFPGQIAMAGVPFLPVPGTGEVEREWWLDDEGIIYHGIIDWSAPARVLDHKTTTDFKWMKDLETDVQAHMYALVAVVDGAPVVNLEWIYYRTHRPEARRSAVRWTPEKILGFYSEIIRPAAEQISAATDFDALELNPQHCSAFGGCPHSAVCPVTTQERFFSIMNISDFIKSRTQNTTPSAPEAPPVPEAAPEAPPEAPPVPEVPAPEAPPVPEPVPEVPEARTVTGIASLPDPDDMSTWDRGLLKAKAIDMGIVDEGCKFGAPRILEMILEAQEPPPPVIAPEENIEEVAAALDEPIPYTPRRQIPFLFVDCAPLSGDFPAIRLSALVREAMESLGYAEDYRLHPDNAYGRAAGVLSDAVAEALGDQRVSVVCSTRITEHRDCLCFLEGISDVVVKGL
jgi:hypothetical protein